MKKWLVLLITICVIFTGLYAFTFFFVMPKSAAIALPFKWKNIKPGLKRNEYAFYLGVPSTGIAAAPAQDVWMTRDGNYTFQLQLSYDKDSVATNLQVTYRFTNYLFYKQGIISEETAE